MGVLIKSCWTNAQQPAPDPNPNRWVLLDKAEFDGGYALKVKYLGCTNFEGEKVMVFRGKFVKPTHLDPHFRPSADAPIARFRPDAFGWSLALSLAEALSNFPLDGD